MYYESPVLCVQLDSELIATVTVTRMRATSQASSFDGRWGGHRRFSTAFAGTRPVKCGMSVGVTSGGFKLRYSCHWPFPFQSRRSCRPLDKCRRGPPSTRNRCPGEVQLQCSRRRDGLWSWAGREQHQFSGLLGAALRESPFKGRGASKHKSSCHASAPWRARLTLPGCCGFQDGP